MNTVLLKALAYCAAYIAINAMFGLAPLWILLEETLINTNDSGVKEMINDGIIIFFCIAIIGSISFDYVLTKPKINEIMYYFAIVFPFLLFITVAIAYILLHKSPKREIIDNFNNIQQIIAVISIGYGFILKTDMFIKELNRELKNI